MSGWGTGDDAVDDSSVSGVHGAAGFGGLLLSKNLSTTKDVGGRCNNTWENKGKDTKEGPLDTHN